MKSFQGNTNAAFDQKAAAQDENAKWLAELEKQEAILRKNPNDAVTHFNKGEALYELARYDNAIASYDAALRINPNYVEAHNSKGITLKRLGRSEEAIICYNAILRINPNDIIAYKNKGNTLNNLGRYSEALVSFDAALKIDPNNANAHLNKGGALIGLLRYSEALVSCDAALRIDPNDANAHCNKGNALNGLDRYSEALVSLDAALRIDPNDAYAHINKGNALNGLGRYSEALVSLDAALRIDPNNAYTHRNKGRALIGLGRYSEALVSCDAALKIDPNNAYAHRNKGGALIGLLRYSEALVSLDAALRINPNDAYAHSFKGNALNNLGRYSEALVSYDAALKIDPNNAHAHSNKGCALLGLKRFAEALISFSDALKLDSKSVYAINGKANVLYYLNQWREAERDFSEALQYLSKNDLDNLISYKKNHPDYLLPEEGQQLAKLKLQQQSQSLESKENTSPKSLPTPVLTPSTPQPPITQHAVATQGTDNKAESKKESALIHYSEALASYDAALKINPNDANAHCNKGAALNGLLRYSEALVSFDAALKIDPNDAVAKGQKQVALDALAKQKPETTSTSGNVNTEAKLIPSAPPEKSWHFDASIKPTTKPPDYVLIPAAENDMKKVNEYYQRAPVVGLEIRSVKVIYNPKFNRVFSLTIETLHERHNNPVFAPKWATGNDSDWRRETNTQLEQAVAPYQDNDFPNVKLVPLWHGTKAEILPSLFKTGFASLSSEDSTDLGYFGRGFYSAFEAEYSYRIYCKGALLVNWVAFYSAYPVIHGDRAKLMGKGNYKNYDAHFIPVISEVPNNPNCASYIPCKPKQKFTYRELVVFDRSQCMPRYLVELQPSLPKPVSSASHEQKSQPNKPGDSSSANLGMFASSAAIASSSSFNPNSANANIANASGYGVNAAPTALGKKG